MYPLPEGHDYLKAPENKDFSVIPNVQDKVSQFDLGLK